MFSPAVVLESLLEYFGPCDTQRVPTRQEKKKAKSFSCELRNYGDMPHVYAEEKIRRNAHAVVYTNPITERPGAPGRPVVQDQNVDSVRLLWSAPTQDGGSPVRYYTVEMCTDVSRIVEEPKRLVPQEVEPEAVDYDRLDSMVDLSKHRPIDINHLPNDLQAKYIICEELGQGAYGTVYRAIEKATGKTWAAKMVQVTPPSICCSRKNVRRRPINSEQVHTYIAHSNVML
ncbi:unnamed protein product [Heligmosomoides polygyrus]|uniref:Protein kinase domain-containing protein n=1 Tax=Heligmosomoides polygyrus TaxID=6339 RepID=A0A183F5T2_HELPZ|nr:unnamed protein product [Heligmosomoides polygyrus]